MLEDAKETYNEKLKQRESKHQMEMTKIQEQLEADFRIWKRETETKMKLRETERENSIREQYRLKRDQQIDEVVARVCQNTPPNYRKACKVFNSLHRKFEPTRFRCRAKYYLQVQKL